MERAGNLTVETGSAAANLVDFFPALRLVIRIRFDPPQVVTFLKAHTHVGTIFNVQDKGFGGTEGRRSHDGYPF